MCIRDSSNTSLRDLLNFIGSSTGINVTYDRDFQDRSVTVQLEGVTLNQALQQVMLSNQIFYKVLNERTIIIATDNTAKRQQYEEQVIKTFFISHADAVELAQIVNTVILAPQMAIQPRIAPNKTANTLTVRAAAPVMEIIEQVIRMNDKPRAEVIVDVQILEVSRERAKRFGLNLTDYALGGIFSPEQAPGGSSTTPPATAGGATVLKALRGMMAGSAADTAVGRQARFEEQVVAEADRSGISGGAITGVRRPCLRPGAVRCDALAFRRTEFLGGRRAGGLHQ